MGDDYPHIFVFNWWTRDPEGKVLPKPGPRGKRTPNMLQWGGSLNDFFWIPRIPSVPNYVTIWTRSQIQEFGENYTGEEHDYEPQPSVRQPWPLLICVEHSDDCCGTGGADKATSEKSNIKGKGKANEETPETENDHLAPSKADDGSDDEGQDTSDIPKEYILTVGTFENLPVRKWDFAGEDALLKATTTTPENPVDQPASTWAINSDGSAEVTSTEPKTSNQAPTAIANIVSSSPESAEKSGTVEPELDVGAQPESQTEGSAEQTQKDDQGEAKSSSTAEKNSKDTEFYKVYLPQIEIRDWLDFNPCKKSPKFGNTYSQTYKLQEFIPAQCFPDILVVNDPQCLTESLRIRKHADPHAVEATPRKYKRVWPIFPRDLKHNFSYTEPPKDKTDPFFRTEPNTAYLNLAAPPMLGLGNHSVAFRGALRLPAPLSADTPDGTVSVGVKIAFNAPGARRMLRREAEVYNSFPRHMMEEWEGLNIVPPLKSPQPVGALAPKFFGYYVPEDETLEACKAAAEKRGSGLDAFWETLEQDHSQSGYESEDEKKVDQYKHVLSPILLLEDCGTPVDFDELTPCFKEQCHSIMLRLHLENYVHGSFYARNFLVQPGPLSVPPSERSLDRPSFRLIDFGRADAYPLFKERHKSSRRGKNDTEKEEDVDAELGGKWIDLSYEEEKRARNAMNIERYLY